MPIDENFVADLMLIEDNFIDYFVHIPKPEEFIFLYEDYCLDLHLPE